LLERGCLIPLEGLLEWRQRGSMNRDGRSRDLKSQGRVVRRGELQTHWSSVLVDIICRGCCGVDKILPALPEIHSRRLG